MTVCTGNICRSPMAEVLLRQAFDDTGLDVIVTSSGISDEEQGNPMDYRAAETLARNNIAGKPNHKARQATTSDIANADLIIPMTSGHAKYLRRMADHAGLTKDIKLMRSFDPDAPQIRDQKHEYVLDVDDPWYGGDDEFQGCLEELQAAVPGVVEYVRQQLK